eukprot:7739-Heterococcus_DN1.PRE.1
MLEPVLIAIMNTPQFQRLGSLKQLGTSDYVFRGATHTRFSHSVGVAHLAGRMVETFMRSQRNLDITRTDYLCVKIAALAHDLGHGAFSHVWDNLFMRSYVAELHPDKQKWSHEDGSIFMLQHLLKSNNIDLKVYGLDSDGSGRDQLFIEEMIKGVDAAERKGRGPNKLLHSILCYDLACVTVTLLSYAQVLNETMQQY